MKIGLIIYGDLNTLSGGYRYDRHLVQSLKAYGHDVMLYSQPMLNDTARLAANFMPSLLHQIEADSLDLLLQDELNHPSLFLFNRYLKRRINVPIITIVHHLYSSEPHSTWLRYLYHTVEKNYLQTVDGFIFNSRTTQQTVLPLIDATLPHVVALPGKDTLTFSLDRRFIERRCRLKRPLQICFVGNLIPRKALTVLVQSVATLPRQTWQLHIIGNPHVDPAYTAEVQRLVSHYQLESQVRFWGKLPLSHLTYLCMTSDILAVPSTYEGFGMVYVEALGAGLPVLASRYGGGQEIITHGEHGYLVAPELSEITAALTHVIATKSWLEQLSLRAHQHYTEFPTWADSMAQIRVFLEANC